MFGMLSSLTKAAVGVALVAPVSVLADCATLGGAITDKKQPYTADALQEVLRNLEQAVKSKN